MADIDLSSNFAGKQVCYPLLINAITGGTEQAGYINQVLAGVARKYGLAMAVGSQAIAIKAPQLWDTFSVVREVNPDGVIIANVGAATPVAQALEAVHMIAADALQLHFNVPQELAMREGDRTFKGITANVSEIAALCPVPVIAKEVGFGFSRESVQILYEAGVRIFDNGGQGGTNFIRIEDQRQGCFQEELCDWGIPTAVSLAEIVALRYPLTVIASGGIRTAADAAKALALGADLIGLAGPLLKVLLNHGSEALDQDIEGFLYRLKAVLLMTGSRDIAALQQRPLLILNDTAEWLRGRSIDPAIWVRR